MWYGESKQHSQIYNQKGGDMPRKVQITHDGMKKFCARLYHEEKFIFVPHTERIKIINNYRAKLTQFLSGKKKKIPSGQNGLQTVVKYETEHFIVYVFTTFVWQAGQMKDSDEGWVIIVDKRKSRDVCFYSFPIRRTKDYLKTLGAYAEAEKNRVDTMPCCSECENTPLTIKLVVTEDVESGLRKYGYTLVCPNNGVRHKKSTIRNFYTGMDPAHRAFIEKRFEQYDKYQKKNLETGSNRKQSREIRAKKTSGSRSRGVVADYNDTVYSNDTQYADGPHLDG
jgi:hypothetical protein